MRKMPARQSKRPDRHKPLPKPKGKGCGASKRIQRRRTKGWRMPPNCVYVGRPTKFGNPFGDAIAFRYWLEQDPSQHFIGSVLYGLNDRRKALLDGLPSLRGKRLACWCPLGQPCHADVLLELANHTLHAEP